VELQSLHYKMVLMLPQKSHNSPLHSLLNSLKSASGRRRNLGTALLVIEHGAWCLSGIESVYLLDTFYPRYHNIHPLGREIWDGKIPTREVN